MWLLILLLCPSRDTYVLRHLLSSRSISFVVQTSFVIVVLLFSYIGYLMSSEMDLNSMCFLDNFILSRLTSLSTSFFTLTCLQSSKLLFLDIVLLGRNFWGTSFSVSCIWQDLEFMSYKVICLECCLFSQTMAYITLDLRVLFFSICCNYILFFNVILFRVSACTLYVVRELFWDSRLLGYVFTGVFDVRPLSCHLSYCIFS